MAFPRILDCLTIDGVTPAALLSFFSADNSVFQKGIGFSVNFPAPIQFTHILAPAGTQIILTFGNAKVFQDGSASGGGSVVVNGPLADDGYSLAVAAKMRSPLGAVIAQNAVKNYAVLGATKLFLEVATANAPTSGNISVFGSVDGVGFFEIPLKSLARVGGLVEGYYQTGVVPWDGLNANPKSNFWIFDVAGLLIIQITNNLDNAGHNAGIDVAPTFTNTEPDIQPRNPPLLSEIQETVTPVVNVIPGQAGRQITVVGFELTVAAGQTRLQDTGTAVERTTHLYSAAGGQASMVHDAMPGEFLFQLPVNTGLDIFLSGSVACCNVRYYFV